MGASISGLGSGMDIETLISGLVSSSKGPLNAANAKVSSAQSAVTAMSSVGSLLSDLKSVVDSLDTASELSGYKGTTTNTTALSLSVSGSASAGNYKVNVNNLVQEQRTYSASQASASTALGMSGTLSFSQNGNNYSVTVDASDTLTTIGTKINDTGAGISANIFADGTSSRLQLRSTTSGANGAFTITQTGLDLGLNDTGATVQAAKDASVTVDGITVTSSSNTITGTIPGVTMTLLAPTTESFQVGVAADSSSMKTSLQSFIEKYNAVVNKVHTVSGYGEKAASVTELKGDSTLRSLTSAMSDKLLSTVTTGGNLKMLSDLGIKLNNDGTLKLDSTKLDTALNADPTSFRKVLAGTDSTDGVMDLMSKMLKGFTDTASGLIANKKEALNSKIKLFQAQATREQTRLDTMEERLRKLYTQMDTTVGANNKQLTYLSSWSSS